MSDIDGENYPAAMLTNAQRKYARGEKKYPSSAEYGVKRRMRERVEATMRDIQLLAESELSEEMFSHPPDEDVERAADVLQRQSVGAPDVEGLREAAEQLDKAADALETKVGFHD